jgi:Flp pilus assembly protein CpaB
MSRLLRERGLALAALILALVGLVSGGGGSGAAQARVIVAAHGVPADVVVPRAAVRLTEIDARDVTPGMATRADEVVGRTARVRLAAGDYVLRSALADRAEPPALRAGERAVPISIDPAAAPPLTMLRAGSHVDVVAERDADANGPARSQLIARNLTLLVPAHRSDAGLVATVRAPLEVALALATAQARSHRLRLLVRPAAGGAGG